MSVVNCEHVYHTQETEEQLCFCMKDHHHVLYPNLPFALLMHTGQRARNFN